MYEMFIQDPVFFHPGSRPFTSQKSQKSTGSRIRNTANKMRHIKFKMITLLTASPGLGVSSSLVWSLSISRTSSPTSTTASPPTAFQDPNPSYDFL
jgi:hypothetical protein